MKYFTVTSQFSDPDPVLIDETELAKAIHGQLTGNPTVFKRASLSGSMIKNSKIVPNYDNESTHLVNNQWLPSRRIQQEYFLAIENAAETVKAKIENRAPQLKELPEAGNRLYTKEPTQIGALLDQGE